MEYRRSTPWYRRYEAKTGTHTPAAAPAPAGSPGGDTPNSNTTPLNEPIRIPLPNEKEAEPDEVRMKPKHRKKSSLLDLFQGHIDMDEIILLGLIVVLLDEGIEDDFLLVMLIFLLLTGRR